MQEKIGTSTWRPDLQSLGPEGLDRSACFAAVCNTVSDCVLVY
jgi:hypothetical protein